MFFDHANTIKEGVRWDLRKTHMLMVCLSLHGTSRCDEIAEYEIFRGYQQKHLHGRTLNLLRFHSVKPLRKHYFDIYLIRDFFLDAEAAADEGFLLDKDNRYYHPTMTDEEKRQWFLQFELSEDRRQSFELLKGQLNTFVWNLPDFSRHSTIEIIKSLLELEAQLARQIELTEAQERLNPSEQMIDRPDAESSQVSTSDLTNTQLKRLWAQAYEEFRAQEKAEKASLRWAL